MHIICIIATSCRGARTLCSLASSWTRRGWPTESHKCMMPDPRDESTEAYIQGPPVIRHFQIVEYRTSPSNKAAAVQPNKANPMSMGTGACNLRDRIAFLNYGHDLCRSGSDRTPNGLRRRKRWARIWPNGEFWSDRAATSKPMFFHDLSPRRDRKLVKGCERTTSPMDRP